jgi:thioredoxin family protein
MESFVFYASYVALWILVLLETGVLLALVRAVYKPEGSTPAAHVATPGPAPQVGDPLPAFSTIDALTGATVTSASLMGKLTALLFVSPHCATCMTTLDELSALRHKVHGNVALVCGGTQEECVRVVRRYGELVVPTLLDEDNAIRNAFRVPGTPYAVLVNEVGEIEFTGQPMRHGEVEDLLDRGQPMTAASLGD